MTAHRQFGCMFLMCRLTGFTWVEFFPSVEPQSGYRRNENKVTRSKHRHSPRRMVGVSFASLPLIVCLFVFPLSPCLMTSHMTQYSCCLSINVSLSRVCIETSLSLFRLPPGGEKIAVGRFGRCLLPFLSPPLPSAPLLTPHTSFRSFVMVAYDVWKKVAGSTSH